VQHKNYTVITRQDMILCHSGQRPSTSSVSQ